MFRTRWRARTKSEQGEREGKEPPFIESQAIYREPGDLDRGRKAHGAARPPRVVAAGLHGAVLAPGGKAPRCPLRLYPMHHSVGRRSANDTSPLEGSEPGGGQLGPGTAARSKRLALTLERTRGPTGSASLPRWRRGTEHGTLETSAEWPRCGLRLLTPSGPSSSRSLRSSVQNAHDHASVTSSLLIHWVPAGHLRASRRARRPCSAGRTVRTASTIPAAGPNCLDMDLRPGPIHGR